MFNDLLRFDKNKVYTYIDVETFCLCLNFCQNRPWQIGILKVKGEEILERRDIIVNWTKETDLRISVDAAKITRYDHNHVLKNGISPKEAWSITEPYLNDCDYIIGHNVLNFDLYLIKGFSEYLNRPWKHFVPKMIDTRSLIQGYKLGMPYNREKDSLIEYQYRMSNKVVKGVKTSLKVVAKEYGIVSDESRLHDAVYDLEINKQVWDKLKYQIDI